MAASVWWVIANVAAMAGTPVVQLDTATLFAVLAATPLGILLTVRFGALICFVALLAARAPLLMLVPAAMVALASAAWAGHAGAGEGNAGVILQASDTLHLVAASLWLGALLSFLADLTGNPILRQYCRALPSSHKLEQPLS
ncbi:hypothetical protein [Novosphingobium album (ex Hu et al. 2023)]|uniref:Copper resistance protein D domain-containing protein n=1 Tax=Novosphingobium album (ex Hu et al. 2023) TaxID=2930093 RepID=A0ABT0B7Z1_9SPHN|nr:hypothetical protein [Novosphingobium album (ex Hu et al. 2023)]MCJ2180991.1 hypothetical protein [Novosphingobium album (ex Hu et al. 2023)]